MGLFTCCTSDRKHSKSHETEARHARIVEIYRQAEGNTRPDSPTAQLPPPSYHEVVYDDMTGTVVLDDEKAPQIYISTQAQAQTQAQRAQSISRPGSPQTSIFSVPSTRLTDITSAHTGASAADTLTVGRGRWDGESRRSSLVFDSAPPSYYDGRSVRERSRSPGGDEGGQRPSDENTRQHPVMNEWWLEVLQRTAESQQGRMRGG